MKRTNRVYPRFLCFTIVSTLILTGFASDPISPAHASYFTELQNSWNRFFNAPLPRPYRGGRRPTLNLCLIAPFSDQSDKSSVVSSARPTFAWTGNAEWIEVRSSDGKLVLEKIENLPKLNATKLVQSITYNGKALQPETTYQWVIKLQDLEASLPVTFRVMSQAEQNQVAKALRTLETEKSAGMTPDQKALHRADYFASRQLWSDFWQTVLSIQKPSPELKTLLQNTVTWVCTPPMQNQQQNER